MREIASGNMGDPKVKKTEGRLCQIRRTSKEYRVCVRDETIMQLVSKKKPIEVGIRFSSQCSPFFMHEMPCNQLRTTMAAVLHASVF